ncbi:hypothetical protein KC343_g2395 [Hortaea werneckii]|nr:hypothetical protein KC352_g16299 [Hortaea werneckii]KAI7563104.1 hypothetical protein KC317_g7964 [Hortaea werneckii]KAI7612876.1 hypothetical protein KC346_g7600 [Hortaea werneckii]KAI7634462.1 hypothetical protein KC343_g2395 [Hortaea werneckii]KAI7664025.1 hypothetical protein KC319_g7591 [Hortaea werneckii]
MVGKGSKAAPLWTTAQEDCLIASIERVQGPFWGKILLLHGTNGTESNILGGRSIAAISMKAKEVYQRRGLLAPLFLQSSYRFKRQDESNSGQHFDHKAGGRNVLDSDDRVLLSSSSPEPELRPQDTIRTYPEVESQSNSQTRPEVQTYPEVEETTTVNTDGPLGANDMLDELRASKRPRKGPKTAQCTESQLVIRQRDPVKMSPTTANVPSKEHDNDKFEKGVGAAETEGDHINRLQDESTKDTARKRKRSGSYSDE